MSELLEAALAFRVSKTVFAAVEFRLFDWLADNPLSAEELVYKTRYGTETISRLFDACVGFGLLEKERKKYKNSALAAHYLCWSSQSTLNYTF